MATPLNGTVIITGANGSLGSKIAVKIAQRRPLVHLLLTVRDVSSKSIERISERIRSFGPRSVEIASLDLASFHSIHTFTNDTVRRVREGDVPSVQLLINCAAVSSFRADAPTEDGFDLVYQTNCLGPLLLTINLLEVFRAHRQGNGARVMNIGSSAMAMGKLDFFEKDIMSGQKVDSSLSLRDGLVRYGSSKLLLNAAMYALRRNLALTSQIILTIFTLDPGRIASSGSRLTPYTPARLRLAKSMVNGIHPLIKLISPNFASTPGQSADVVVAVAFAPSSHDTIGEEKYFLLGKACNVKEIVQVTNNHDFMDVFFRQAIADIGLRQENIS